MSQLMVLAVTDVDLDGTLDFGEFCQAVTTYCMLEVEEVLKCIFFVETLILLDAYNELRPNFLPRLFFCVRPRQKRLH